MHLLPGQWRIPNYRLSSGMVPRADAREDELYAFAYTFNGYLVIRPVEMGRRIAAFLDDFEACGLPKLSLTIARTALFGFQRWDHFANVAGWNPRHVR
jgi:hypothetical protein